MPKRPRIGAFDVWHSLRDRVLVQEREQPPPTELESGRCVRGPPIQRRPIIARPILLARLAPRPRNSNVSHTLNERGFTLSGVIIALTITLVLASIALPPMGSTIRSVRRQATTSELAGDLARARIEAMKRNRVVDVTIISETEYEIEFVGVRELENGAVFLEAPSLVQFAPFGPMLTGPAQFVLGFGSDTSSVSLTASGLSVLD